jgi:hypothetical protein
LVKVSVRVFESFWLMAIWGYSSLTDPYFLFALPRIIYPQCLIILVLMWLWMGALSIWDCGILQVFGCPHKPSLFKF